MGQNSKNLEVVTHRNVNASANDYRMHVHQASPPIDQTSPVYDQADHESLVANAPLGQSDFDNAVEAISTTMATWWSGRTQAVQEGFRDIYIDIA